MYSFILHTSRLRAWIKREEVKLKVCISQYYLSNYECTGRQSGMLFITICCLLVSVVFQLVFSLSCPTRLHWFGKYNSWPYEEHPARTIGQREELRIRAKTVSDISTRGYVPATPRPAEHSHHLGLLALSLKLQRSFAAVHQTKHKFKLLTTTLIYNEWFLNLFRNTLWIF